MTDLARFISRRRRRQLISTGLEPVPGQSVVVLSTSALRHAANDQRVARITATSYMTSALIAAAAAAAAAAGR